MKVNVTSHREETINELHEKMITAMWECGEEMEGRAKDKLSMPKPHAPRGGKSVVKPNVITGRLRNSVNHIAYMDDGKAYAVVGTDVFYGPYLEYGTSRSNGWKYPFLRPAVEKNMKVYEAIIKKHLQS